MYFGISESPREITDSHKFRLRVVASKVSSSVCLKSSLPVDASLHHTSTNREGLEMCADRSNNYRRHWKTNDRTFDGGAMELATEFRTIERYSYKSG